MTDLKLKFGDYLYNRLPSVFRTEDKDLVLYKYIQSLVDGGFTPLLSDLDKLQLLVQPELCPLEFLPLLCESLGFYYEYGLAEGFQRKFLNNILYLYSIKGTKPCIEYLVREMSGLPTAIIVENSNGKTNCSITMTIYEDSTESFIVAQSVIVKYVEKFMPLGVTSEIKSVYNFVDTFDNITLNDDEDTIPKICTSLLEIFTVHSDLFDSYYLAKVQQSIEDSFSLDIVDNTDSLNEGLLNSIVTNASYDVVDKIYIDNLFSYTEVR